ncbi:MAG TPA: sodium:solute symporter, partial [Spirochaetota bacterium]|nr:sodium:solute symporter [Spirochaetota bacterium]
MIDYAVIAAYILIINVIGFASSKAATIEDYFQGRGSVPWIAACFSIVATETSTLTFISIPGLAYISDLGFLQVALGYILGRVLVALVLIPRYFSGNVESTYHYLQTRFSPVARRFMAVIFHITRLLADSIRLFATAIPLAMLLGMEGTYFPAILLIGIATFLYTLYGGIRSVVIVDSVQLVLYLFCAVLGLFLIADLLKADVFSVTAMIPANAKQWFHSGLGEGKGLWSGYNIFSGLIGGAFLSFASHGTDHLLVQRALSCKNRADAQKAMVVSGLVVFIQFFLFLALGLFINVLLGGRAFNRPDEVMSFFILNYLPPGVKGL